MERKPRLLLAAALARPGLAQASLPCTGWESSDASLELRGAKGELVTTPQERSQGLLELKVRLRADRLQLSVQ